MFRQAATYSKYLLQSKPFDRLEDEFLTLQLKKVFDKERTFYSFVALDVVRKKNLGDERILTVNDLGAGSRASKSSRRSVKSIADSAVKRKKYAELMFRMVEAFQSNTILELGTSLGITTGYLAKANKAANIYTFEGAEEIAEVARENFSLMKLNNVQLIKGPFDETLPGFLDSINKVDLVFLDGNHSKEPTLRYFEWLLPKLHEKSIVIVDDINWSAGMNEAWQELITRKEITLSLNLFEMGILFFNSELPSKEILVRF